MSSCGISQWMAKPHLRDTTYGPAAETPSCCTVDLRTRPSSPRSHRFLQETLNKLTQETGNDGEMIREYEGFGIRERVDQLLLLLPEVNPPKGTRINV